jgi:hypothetical protein
MSGSAPKPPKPPRGCLFYGLIFGSVLLLLMLVAGLIGLRLLKNMVDRYTDNRPMALPVIQISKAELEALQKRVTEFSSALKAGRPAPVFELTSDQANALIQNSPDLKTWRNRAYVQFTNGCIESQVSLPTDDLGLRALKGRFLNGKARLNLAFENGSLKLTPQSLLVKGKPLPGIYLRKLRHQNLATQLTAEPQAASALDHIQDIQIQDGQLIIVPKERL